MKAEITETGTLIVIPETPLEKYALSAWVQGWSPPLGTPRTSTLQVQNEGIQEVFGLPRTDPIGSKVTP